MKNIHVLPTDKPSRFVTSKYKKKCYLYSIEEFKDIDKFREYDSKSWDSQNIYITSDEEIKDVRPYKDKWQLEKGQILNKFPNYLTDLSDCKLVIMTTDQDLIKDGVQAIDDDFLEWFVKNPSCEFVEVDRDEREVGNHLGGVVVEYGDYKIIIPKEEAIQRLEKYSERFDNDKSPIGNPDTWGKRIVEEPKQETLEELKKWKEEALIAHEINQKVIEKLMAERKLMYSEEELYKLTLESLDLGMKIRQDQLNGYSEKSGKELHKEWFEQFKNK